MSQMLFRRLQLWSRISFFYLGHWRQTPDCNIVNKLYWIWNWINPNLLIWFPGLRHWLLKMTIFIFCAVVNVSLYFRLASFLTLHNFIIAFLIVCLALIVTDYLLFISGISLIGLNWYRSAGYWIIFQGRKMTLYPNYEKNTLLE